MNQSPLCLLPTLKEVQGTENQHSFLTVSGPGPSLPHGLVTDVEGTLLLTIIVAFQCIKGLCSIQRQIWSFPNQSYTQIASVSWNVPSVTSEPYLLTWEPLLFPPIRVDSPSPPFYPPPLKSCPLSQTQLLFQESLMTLVSIKIILSIQYLLLFSTNFRII